MLGDYSRDYGRVQQDATQEAQNYDLQPAQLDATYNNSLAALEQQKQNEIANAALSIEALRPYLEVSMPVGAPYAPPRRPARRGRATSRSTADIKAAAAAAAGGLRSRGPTASQTAYQKMQAAAAAKTRLPGITQPVQNYVNQTPARQTIAARYGPDYTPNISEINAANAGNVDVFRLPQRGRCVAATPSCRVAPVVVVAAVVAVAAEVAVRSHRR